IAVVDINHASSHQVADEINQKGGAAQAYVVDVGDEQAVIQVLARTASHFGRLDAIINSAGVDVTIGIQELETSDWLRVLSTNLTGPFLLAKHGLAHLGAGGHIVNVASTAARRAWPNACAYHASKWGLAGLSQAL